MLRIYFRNQISIRRFVQILRRLRRSRSFSFLLNLSGCQQLTAKGPLLPEGNIILLFDYMVHMHGRPSAFDKVLKVIELLMDIGSLFLKCLSPYSFSESLRVVKPHISEFLFCCVVLHFCRVKRLQTLEWIA